MTFVPYEIIIKLLKNGWNNEHVFKLLPKLLFLQETLSMFELLANDEENKENRWGISTFRFYGLEEGLQIEDDYSDIDPAKLLDDYLRCVIDKQKFDSEYDNVSAVKVNH